VEIGKEALNLIKKMNDFKAVNEKRALTISELVSKLTGYNIKRLPLLFGERYHKIAHTLRKARNLGLIRVVNQGEKEAFYINKNDKVYELAIQETSRRRRF
jgi:hypothetical protein